MAALEARGGVVKYWIWKAVQALLIVVGVFVLAWLAGCSAPVVGGEFYIPGVESVEDVSDWMDVNINYKSDQEQYGQHEYWASPEETMESRWGDCEDIGILWLRLVHDNLGGTGELVTQYGPENVWHIYARAWGVEYYRKDSFKDFSTIPYEVAMARAGGL